MADRKTLLTAPGQTALTGIDFIRVLDKDVQDRIAVFFLVPPQDLTPPLVDPGLVDDVGDTAPAALDIALSAAPGLRLPEVIDQHWHRIAGVTGERVVLEILFDGPGEFTDYTLILTNPQIDHYFSSDVFSFQQACPDPFDCAPDPCPEDELADPQLDYLARDFGSFNRALSDYAARTYPDWRADTPADIAVMLKELLAYAGDELAYLQDRIAQETRFATATQRRSLSALASLVDYRLDPGRSAQAEIAIEVAQGNAGVIAPSHATVWSVVAGNAPVPFRLIADVWTHEDWNAIPLYVLDEDEACLKRGATRAYLATRLPAAGDIDPVSPVPAADYWVGRRMALTWAPESDAQGMLSAIVTITAVTEYADALQLTSGAPTPYVCVEWDTPLPFSAPQAEMVAALNIATVVAGRQVTEEFRIGSNTRFAEALSALPPTTVGPLLRLPRAVEREGPCDRHAGQREAIMRHGLRSSATEGLGWDDATTPRLMLEILDPATSAPDPTEPAWVYFPNLVAADDDDRAFTLEPGSWRDVVHHQRPFDVLIFDDYAGDDGWSIRFASGAFGQPPAVGTVFRVTYDTGPGARANLPAGAISRVSDPTEQGIAGLPVASAVRNPLAVTRGQDEETADHLRLHAPVAYQDNPRRAVRPEDYETILNKLDFLQRANAVPRHTGSWSTDFISVDPYSGTSLDPEDAAVVDREIACIKQAARDAQRLPAEYLDLDLEVTICIAPGHATADVIEAVAEALAPPGLFDPDNFTFGQPLYRSQIEAAVQSVPGVRFVALIRHRLRGYLNWTAFTAPSIPVERNQIIRLLHDPLLPARGTLEILQAETVP